MTLLACVLHFAHAEDKIHLPDWLPAGALTFFCGVFPALGAAMAGISNQGEFRRLSHHSEAMEQQLERLLVRIDKLQGEIAARTTAPGQPSTTVAVLSSEVARLLVNEVLGWRVVLLDRPLNPPA